MGRCSCPLFRETARDASVRADGGHVHDDVPGGVKRPQEDGGVCEDKVRAALESPPPGASTCTIVPVSKLLGAAGSVMAP